MKTLLKIVVILAVIAALLVAGGLFLVERQLQKPEFKQIVLNAARDALGSQVQINDLNISLFRGVTLRGVAIANPEGFNGSLLTADEFVLRYRLLPLLWKRVEIETLALRKPVITLARNDKGDWNYDKIGAKPATTSAPPAAAATPSAPPSTTKAGLDITLSKLALENGTVVMLDEKNKELVRITNINITSKLETSGDKMEGDGDARIETLSAANSLFARNVAAPIKISAERVALAPLSGSLAGGAVSGDIGLKLAGAFQYGVNIKVKDGDMAKLLQEAGSKPVLTGKLQADAALTGTGGLPTMAGNGKLEIVNGTLIGVPLLETLAALLQINELRNLKFTECLFEFTMANNQMPTPVIRLVSPQVKITGKGVVSLADYSLNHEMTLALAPNLLEKVPGEIRDIFQKQSDGFLAITFHVTGPYDNPKNDIKETLIKGAAKSLIQKGLQKLFQ
jgi:uncharacterized protein involved in outer membrane biogenesis